ncbi:CTRL isoform 4 [Pongo abelii]|uniref:CTRL isoform 4 n=1 Tax=Pongo abelii TaxID=9601 RepID=A0A2J8VV17_PONAB|nr:CTRL isoform 4 [Pongo abelii]
MLLLSLTLSLVLLGSSWAWGTQDEVEKGGLRHGKQVLISPMARLRRSCHQTGTELQPEDCQRGECSVGLLALAGVPAGQKRLPLLRCSLISQSWVVTAAHCNASPGRHFVVLGEYDRSSNTEPLQVLSISQAITHPSWNSTTMNNDVTLLKLASPAQYTTRISPVCLASSNEALLSARRETHGCLLVLSPGAPKTAMCAHLLCILELASSAPGSTRS